MVYAHKPLYNHLGIDVIEVLEYVTNVEILLGDALGQVKTLDEKSIQTVITSPPYWGLRDYGTATWEGGDSKCEHTISMPSKWTDKKRRADRPEVANRGGDNSKCHQCGALRIDNQVGLEPSPEDYISNLVLLFDEVKRVLADDGTVWITIGDSYVGQSWSGRGNVIDIKGNTYVGSDGKGRRGAGHKKQGKGLKPKDLVGIPWMLAFAMRNAGWYLRSDIIWAKPNPIPEPVKDRPTRAHEYIFLFSKNRKYYYDYDAVKERTVDGVGWRNPRDVWFITPRQYRGEHIAVFPYEIPERCILAATRVGDTVLDPFVGSGTVCEVARKLERNSIGIELSERYFNIAAKLMSITTLGDFDG